VDNRVVAEGEDGFLLGTTGLPVGFHFGRMKAMTERDDPVLIREVIARALSLDVLTMPEVSALIHLRDEGLWQEVFEAARIIKEKVYGKRIVLFAPLYLSNECSNNCLYCGFRSGNRDAHRKTLTPEEAVREAELLSGRGYRRLLLVASENRRFTGPDYIEEVVRQIYERTDIRILHLNAAPMSVDDFRRLRSAGIGVYQCFQETYHLPTYMRMHPSGTKADYAWRIEVMDRAIEGGFEDIGMGVLLGLYDWRWDVAALISHCRRLISKYGFGPHTLSVPRLQPAPGAVEAPGKYRVSDEDFKKIVAIYRLAIPYTGVVISTREPAALRDELISIGASQISAGSKTSPLGYLDGDDTEQFETGDRRSLEEVMDRIAALDMIPSLCTACYREGRSGEKFREIARKGGMKNFCHDNALLSLKEYMDDCASPEVKSRLGELLEREMEKSRNGLAEKILRIEKGERDLHY